MRCRKDGGKQKVLPAAAYLEMARAAIEQAWPERPGEAVLELHDTVWAQPLIVNGKKQIHLALWVNDSSRISYQIYSKDGEREIVYCQDRQNGREPRRDQSGFGTTQASHGVWERKADNRV